MWKVHLYLNSLKLPENFKLTITSFHSILYYLQSKRVKTLLQIREDLQVSLICCKVQSSGSMGEVSDCVQTSSG